MDGKSRCRITPGCFWWALKNENIHLSDYKTLQQLRLGVQSYVSFYNAVRLHSAVGYRPPDEVYNQSCRTKIKPYRQSLYTDSIRKSGPSWGLSS